MLIDYFFHSFFIHHSAGSVCVAGIFAGLNVRLIAGLFVREIPHEQMENSLGTGGSAAENQRIPACSDALSTEKLWEKLITVERWKLDECECNGNCVQATVLYV
jgi:hypothetical protein